MDAESKAIIDYILNDSAFVRATIDDDEPLFSLQRRLPTAAMYGFAKCITNEWHDTAFEMHLRFFRDYDSRHDTYLHATNRVLESMKPEAIASYLAFAGKYGYKHPKDENDYSEYIYKVWQAWRVRDTGEETNSRTVRRILAFWNGEEVDENEALTDSSDDDGGEGEVGEEDGFWSGAEEEDEGEGDGEYSSYGDGEGED